MTSAQSLSAGAGPVERDGPLEDMPSPTLPSDVDSNEERHPPTCSPTPSPPLGPAMASNNTFEGNTFHRQGHSGPRTLPVPAPLRRNNSNSFMAFSEIPSLPAFLNNCNLSQYLQSFNEAGANDDSMQLILDFDDDELKSIMDHIPMKPFHAVAFKKGIRDLRERSRLGSMHFDNGSQSSFMQPEPPYSSMLHYSGSQFFQQHSQSSQPSLSQTSHPSQSSLNSPQPSRGFSHQGSSQTPGLHRHSSTSKSSSQRQSQGNSTSQHQSYVPTPSQVLSGGAIYQYVGPAPRSFNGAPYIPQPTSLFPQDQPPLQRSSSKNETKQQKRRRSSSETPDTALESSSPVLPEPASFPSVSSWNSTPNQTPSNSQQMSQETRELITRQALIYGKHSSRSLTKYEEAINRAAQSLALEDPSLLTNKGLLWNKAKAKLLHEDYDYKRGKSRSKLPEAAQKKDQKASKERLIQKREANASNAANLRLRRIASLGEQLHRKTAEREVLLAQLLQLELPEYKRANPLTFEAQAKEARDNLARIENDRQSISKELVSLKNKERKHQWYEKRKKHRNDNGEPLGPDDKANAGTDAEADEEAETDTTVDPDGDVSQKSSSSKANVPISVAATAQSNHVPKTESLAAQKPLTFKPHKPTPPSAAPTADTAKAPPSRPSKKTRDVFRLSGYSPVVKG